MQKYIALICAILGLIPAMAYHTPVASAYTNTTCVSLSRSLSLGSRGSDVAALQRFLVSQSFPGGGSWMVTGYYGQATMTGVYDFQRLYGLSQTGSVDSATRSMINSVSCGYASNISTNYSDMTSTPTYTQQVVVPQSFSASSPTIYSLSASSGAAGSTLTINGGGFTPTNNTVYLGNIAIPNITSVDGRTISFIVPQTVGGYASPQIILGTYSITVTNGSGYQSNSATFAVTGYGANSNPTITNVSGPSSLGAGQSGTWSVTLNAPSTYPSTVSVNWGDQAYTYQAIQQQTVYGPGVQTVNFTHAYSGLGTYTPTFTASNGVGSATTMTSTVTVTTYNGNSTIPTISAISPPQARIGTSITIYGTNLTGSNTLIFNGLGAIYNIYSQSANSISFVIPSSVSAYCVNGQVCPQYTQVLTPGTYSITIVNQNGTSNVAPLTITQ